MIQALIFDLDGTIVNTFFPRTEALRQALSEFNITEPSEEDLLNIVMGNERLLKYLSGKEKSEEIVERANMILNDGYVPPLFEGMRFVLDELQSKDVPLALVTDRRRNSVDEILEKNDLKKYFPIIYAASRNRVPKPSPEGLMRALKDLKVEPRDAVYIGDRSIDIQAAHTAGMQVVTVLWAKSEPYEDLAIHWPDHWAEVPEDILSIWRELSDEERPQSA